ncbi:Aste57867_19188 [Aphanomyces stellatus]|uniref:Aste57867_19188 protein n=1 Tax=Aphanomyces stellatus TaxID=120398 RepID=A0A485LDZ0_9STRA|nr:hypothetical protein As57867_019124 [Aphanomyces stellatus]VFT95910.1 Aste57867_19188 [Aphanomyces stellatus]
MASHDHHSGCDHASASSSALGDDYDIHGDDPTLSACCMKDKKEQAEYVRIQTILQRHDVAQHRMDARYVATVPSHVPPAPSLAMVNTLDDDDDEFDYLLDDANSIETDRRAALQAKLARRAQGLGVVWGDKEFLAFHARVQANDWNALIQAKQNRPTVVACRAVDGVVEATTPSVLTAALLNCADKYIGTCVFAVSPAASGAALQELCRRTSFQGPVLVALSAHGDVIAHIKLAEDFKEEMWEGQVMPWLKKCNVLRDEYVPPRTTTQQPTAADTADDGGFDCGKDSCRLRYGYYHEHIGSSVETKAEVSEWRH